MLVSKKVGIEAIEASCEKMMNHEVSLLPKPEALTPEESASLPTEYDVMDAVWGSRVHLREMFLTTGVYRKVPASLRLLVKVGDVESVAVAEYTNKERAFPPGMEVYRQHNHYIDSSTLAHKGVTERCRAINDVRVKYRAIKKQLTAFVDAHKSTNDALKAMPELSMYLGSEVMAKIEKKPARSKSDKEETLPEVDLEYIVSAAVAHRIGGE